MNHNPATCKDPSKCSACIDEAAFILDALDEEPEMREARYYDDPRDPMFNTYED